MSSQLAPSAYRVEKANVIPYVITMADARPIAHPEIPSKVDYVDAARVVANVMSPTRLRINALVPMPFDLSKIIRSQVYFSDLHRTAPPFTACLALPDFLPLPLATDLTRDITPHHALLPQGSLSPELPNVGFPRLGFVDEAGTVGESEALRRSRSCHASGETVDIGGDGALSALALGGGGGTCASRRS